MRKLTIFLGIALCLSATAYSIGKSAQPKDSKERLAKARSLYQKSKKARVYTERNAISGYLRYDRRMFNHVLRLAIDEIKRKNGSPTFQHLMEAQTVLAAVGTRARKWYGDRKVSMDGNLLPRHFPHGKKLPIKTLPAKPGTFCSPATYTCKGGKRTAAAIWKQLQVTLSSGPVQYCYSSSGSGNKSKYTATAYIQHNCKGPKESVSLKGDVLATIGEVQTSKFIFSKGARWGKSKPTPRAFARQMLTVSWMALSAVGDMKRLMAATDGESKTLVRLLKVVCSFATKHQKLANFGSYGSAFNRRQRRALWQLGVLGGRRSRGVRRAGGKW